MGAADKNRKNNFSERKEFMKKKQIIKMAAMGLALTMLAGCASKPADSGDTAGGESSGTSVSSGESSGEETNQEESSQAQEDSNQEVPVIDIGLRAGNSYVQACPDINTDEHVLAFEEKMGVDLDITLIQHDGFTEKLGMMLAQGDFPDVISGDMPYTSVMAGAIENGLFLPLDDLLEEYAPNLMAQVPENVWDELRGPDGHIYAIGDFMTNTARRCTVIRKDLLEKLNLEVPVTLDDYYNVLVAFKNAGVKYPFIGREKFKYSETFFAAYGVVPTTWQQNENGEVVPAYILPEMKEALAFYKKLYDEGLIDAESLTNNGTVRDQKAAAGDVGMMVVNISAAPGYNIALKENVPDAEWICVASPENPNGGSHGYAAFTPTANVHYINAKCENPEEIVKFFDKMLDPDPDLQRFLTYGVEGEFYTLNADGTVNLQLPEVSPNPFDVIPQFLRRIKDAGIDRATITGMQGGPEAIEYYDTKAKDDILTYIQPINLQSIVEHPELSVEEDKQELFINYASKVMIGTESLDNFDKFVEEWMERGGSDVIKEATEQYNNGTAKERK